MKIFQFKKHSNISMSIYHVKVSQIYRAKLNGIENESKKWSQFSICRHHM